MDEVSLLVTVPATVLPSFKTRVAVWPAVEAFLLHAPSVAKRKRMTITGCFMRTLPFCNEISAESAGLRDS